MLFSMSTLYVVATPIGNLDDLSRRAEEILKSVALIACEDTRRAKQLLQRFGINTSVTSLHQHSGTAKEQTLVQQLLNGISIAMVSDAGTPGIADPGGRLVAAAVAAGVNVVPIPGANAAVTLLSVCGWPADQFLFLGFLPHKKGRQTALKAIAVCEYPVVLYESVHRIEKLFSELQRCGLSDRVVVVGRELTKQFETITRGTVAEVAAALSAQPIKGEYVVALASAEWRSAVIRS